MTDLMSFDSFSSLSRRRCSRSCSALRLEMVSLSACMYICICVHVYMCICACIYVSVGDGLLERLYVGKCGGLLGLSAADLRQVAANLRAELHDLVNLRG